MPFREKILSMLKKKLPATALKKIPSGYNLFKDIMLVRLDRSVYKYKKIIGNAILKTYPYVKTVLLEKSIKGRKRRPRIEIIAGRKNTKTIFSEAGCKFFIDFSKVMWSGGNKYERTRIASQVRNGEVIVDMFAGIGYWSIFIAKMKNVKIYAIDINPDAIKILRRNAQLNGIGSRINIIKGDCRKVCKGIKEKSDRIIMGYLHNTEQFLPAALKLSKKGTIIHFHRSAPESELKTIQSKILEIATGCGMKVKINAVRRVKSIAPRIWHYVFDIIRHG